MKALSTEGVAPSEFSRTMAPHPLMYQELAHDPEYQLYNDRLTPVRFADVTADDMYWKVRREVILRHTGELPIEFVGPDAERLANRVFPRDVSKVRVGRCSYQFACYHDGGVAQLGRAISRDGVPIGQVCSTAWSPYLQCGVAIARMDDPADGPGTQLDVESCDGIMLRGELCTLPMYDPDRLIPRGRLIDIPDQR